MRLLAVDTSTEVCNVCILDGDTIVAEYLSRSKTTHTERLMPAMKHLFDRLDWKIAGLDALAVTQGPGSFTGLRISLSVIKGLAFALKIPVYPANALEVAAHQIAGDGLICPMMDARRGEIFTCLWERKGNELKLAIPPKSIRPEAWRRELPPDSISFCGPGTDIFFGSEEEGQVIFHDFVLARTLAFLAQRGLAHGQGIPGAELKAAYLRPSDAEIKGPRPPKIPVR
jgi:tRNA threonylcarbamoyladenosine biosynthesis protein TsaB